MLLVGLLAFGCGVLVGYVSLRSLGWLLVLLCFSLEARANYTSTIVAHNVGSTNVWVATRYDGAQWSSWQYLTPGQWWTNTTIVGDTWKPGVNWGNDWPAGPNNVVADDSGGPQALFISSYNGSSVSVSYYTSVCWTNTGSYPARAHVAYSDGTYADSGILPPNGIFCANKTNATWFQWQICDVQFLPDGTASRVNCSAVSNPSTNMVPGSGGSGQGNYVGGGVAPNNPIGSGAGAGNTNGLTGGQYANGVSNVINQIYQSGNAGNAMAQANAQALNAAMYGISNDIVNQTLHIDGLGSNVTAEVKQGSSNMVAAVNSQGSNTVAAVNAQGSNTVGAVSAGSSNIVNAVNNQTPGQGTNSGPDYTGLLSAISNNTMYASNFLFTPGNYTNHGLDGGADIAGAGRDTVGSNWMQSVRSAWLTVFDTNGVQVLAGGTNWAPSSGDSSIWTVPGLKTNVAGGVLVLRVRETAFYRGMAPWLRGLAMFWLMWMGIKFMNFRIQEEAIRLGWVDGCSPLKEWRDWWFAVIMVSTVMAALPLVLSAGVATVLGLRGGGLVNPFSEAGIATAGPYQGSIMEGLAILYDLFPLMFATALVMYLFVFEQVCTAVVIGGQRVIRFLGK